jgi:UDP-N-acetylglucosamine--N-acetylmuramyl-(pentapeptide) pyrophosphoryl-undecaprenol N-acetylglucosamine transferase
MTTAGTIVLAAGGTGGHVFPAQALAAALKDRSYHLALITDRRGGAVGALASLETHRIRAGGIAGKSVGQRLYSAAELAWGAVQARRLLGRLKPAVVAGFGGYASLPTMAAAVLAGLPTLVHEQNAVLGRANRLLATRVGRIATSFERSSGIPDGARARTVHTGMPVRPEIAAMRERAYPPLDGTGALRLLVLGGSQGATVLSKVVPAAIERLPDQLRERLKITQQCRPADLDQVRAAYAALGIRAELATFFDDVPERLASTHLMIGRAGASTIAEVTTVGRPSILVPYPHAIDDHQTANAHAIDASGAGWMIPEPVFTPEHLAQRLESLAGMPALLIGAAASARAFGRPDAAERLADAVVHLAATTSTQRRVA